jgi:very-short-patch-repair endonuclease
MICLDDISAARITLKNTWLLNPAREKDFCSRIGSLVETDMQTLDKILDTLAEDEMLHLVVPGQDHRVMRSRISYRVHKDPLPAHSFILLSDVWVACPELWLSELALGFSPIGYLKLLGMAFGGFTPNVASETGLDQRNFPLTTPQAMERFLSSAKNIPGSNAAKRLLSLAPVGAESPQEVNLFLRLTLPCRWGGRGIPAPLVNPKLVLDAKTQVALGKGSLRPDLFWPEQRLCIEYDGKLHSEPDKICKDAARRNFLLSKGVKVITVTSEQMSNPHQFEELVKTICKITGTRYFSPESKRGSKIRWLEHELRTNSVTRQIFG